MLNFNGSVTVVAPRCAVQHTVAVEQQSNPHDARYACLYVRKVDVILLLLTVSISQSTVAEPCYWRLHYPPLPIIPSHCSSLFGARKTATDPPPRSCMCCMWRGTRRRIFPRRRLMCVGGRRTWDTPDNSNRVLFWLVPLEIETPISTALRIIIFRAGRLHIHFNQK